jgi:hypothetical protein
VHAPREDTIDDIMDSFYDELGRVFDQFPRYDMKILLGEFNAKVGREISSNRQLGMRVHRKLVMINGVRVVNFATSKNLFVKSTMFRHRNIHKYTWTSLDEKTHNQIDHILIDRRRHSSVPDVRFLEGLIVTVTIM